MDPRHSQLHPFHRRSLLAAALIAVASVAAAWFGEGLRVVRLLHLKTGDAHVLLSAAQRPYNIVLLVVDQSTLDALPEPMLFWHRHYAEAIEAAAVAGAKSFGLDVVFAIPVERWAPGLDARLAEAVVNASRRMPVICAAAPGIRNRQQDWPVPVNVAATALGQMADPRLRADEDDFVRSVELYGSDGLPSVALAVSQRSGLPVRAPNAGGVMSIRYTGPAGTVSRVPLIDFLNAARRGDAQQLQRWVRGKIVLLGADLLTDRHATPYYAFRSGAPANTAGVEIHASAVSNLLNGNFLNDAGASLSILLMLAAAMASAMAATTHGSLRIAALAGAIAALSFGACQALYATGTLLPASKPLLAAALAMPSALVWTRRREAAARRRLHAAVAAYAAPEVAHSAVEEEAIKTPGRRVSAAILFTDIRDFTRYSETVPPERVFDELNSYFERSAGIVASHGGRVIQLTGDGMLALFARQGDTDYATQAVWAAVEIVSGGDGFSTRAGLHAGEAVVGGVGSGNKMEYTALGDAVNVAARLEALNKECGTQLLLSQAVRDLLNDTIETKMVGSFTLRGKKDPQNVFTVGIDPR